MGRLRPRAVVAMALMLAAAGACQLIGGIDSRSLGPGEDAGADGTIGSDSGGSDAGADTSAEADAIGPAFDAGACSSGAMRCNGLQPQSCQAAQWADDGPPCQYVCDAGGCTGVCTPTSFRCLGLQPQSCNTAGEWMDAGAPCPSLCNAGSCAACTPGNDQCNGLQPQTCDDGGLWENVGAACPYVCTASGCTGSCMSGSLRCSGSQPQICDTGTWTSNGSPCPYGCSSGGCVVTYVGEVMADNPIAYWRLDEAAGSTMAADFTGHGNAGTYYGDFALGQAGAILSDPLDTCVKLNGTGAQTGYVGLSQQLSAPLEFNGQGGQAPFTLEAWIKPTSVESEYHGVLSNEFAGGAGKEGYVIYSGYTASGTGIGFERYQNGASTIVQDAGAVAANSGAWYHVVGVYDGSQMRLYVNGQEVASGTSSLQIQSFTCTFNIGATHCGATGTNFQGYVDEVAVYGTALLPTRIQGHYLAAK